MQIKKFYALALGCSLILSTSAFSEDTAKAKETPSKLEQAFDKMRHVFNTAKEMAGNVGSEEFKTVMGQAKEIWDDLKEQGKTLTKLGLKLADFSKITDKEHKEAVRKDIDLTISAAQFNLLFLVSLVDDMSVALMTPAVKAQITKKIEGFQLLLDEYKRKLDDKDEDLGDIVDDIFGEEDVEDSVDLGSEL